MNVTDYSNKLAEKRSEYDSNQTKLRKVQKQEIDGLEKRHKQAQKINLNNYMEDKLSLEDNLKRYKSYNDAKIDREIDNKTKQYSSRLEEEREHFGKRNQEILDNYNKKLANLTDTFDTKERERERDFANYSARLKGNYEDNLASKTDRFDNTVKDLHDRKEKDIAILRGDNDLEKREMNKRFAREKRELSEAASKSKNYNRKLHQNTLESVSNSYEDQLGAMDARYGSLKEFQNSMNNLETRSAANIREIEAEKTRIQTEANREVANLKLKHIKEFGNLKEHKDQSVKYNPTAELKKNFERRVDKLNTELEETNRANFERRKKESFLHKLEVDDINDRNRDEKIQLINATNRQKTNEIGDLKGRFNRFEEQAKTKINELERTLDETNIENRNDKKRSLAEQRLSYERKVRDINNINSDTVNSLKEEMGKEQTRVFQKAKEDQNKEIFNIRADMKHDFNIKEASLQKQITGLNSDIDNLQRDYENKMDMLKELTRNQVETIKKDANDRRIEDGIASRRELKFQKIEFDKRANTIKNDFDQKLSEAKTNNDIQVIKLTKRYEDLLRTERRDFAKEIARRQSHMNTEIKTAREQNSLERDSLINQYETKLTKLKDANRIANELKGMRQSDPDLA